MFYGLSLLELTKHLGELYPVTKFPRHVTVSPCQTTTWITRAYMQLWSVPRNARSSHRDWFYSWGPSSCLGQVDNQGSLRQLHDDCCFRAIIVLKAVWNCTALLIIILIIICGISYTFLMQTLSRVIIKILITKLMRPEPKVTSVIKRSDFDYLFQLSWRF
jgi:hypothetical protein